MTDYGAPERFLFLRPKSGRIRRWLWSAAFALIVAAGLFVLVRDEIQSIRLEAIAEVASLHCAERNRLMRSWSMTEAGNLHIECKKRTP